MDERRLIEQILQGSPAAERAFYDAHVDRVYRLAFRMTGDDSMAQDFTQETFVRAFTRLGDFRGEARLSTWLHRITLSVVLNGLRKLKRQRQHETTLPEEFEPAAAASPLGLRRALQRALEQLSHEARSILILHDVEGYAHKEIGAMLDIPVGTSKARLSRARQALRRLLATDTLEWT